MVETVGGEPATSRSKPTIQVPPRGSVGFLYANGSGPGFSPGPMTLVSSFFPEQGPLSFSQLLAGAMVSPLTEKPPAYDCGTDSEGGAGRKWDRPVNLVVSPPQLQSESTNTSHLFMVPPGLSPSGLLSPLHSPFGMSHQQALAHVTAQAAFSQSFAQMQAEFQHSSSAGTAQAVANQASSAGVEAQMQQIDPPPPHVENSKKERSEVSSVKAAGDKPANDGYNWRKYGQKHVKASECPRSYYKCTHPNCPIKKTVQRSLDGHISEITYKGEHNHDPPKVNKGEKDTSLLETSAKTRVIAGQTDTARLNETAIVNSGTDTVVVVDDGDADEPTTKRRSLDNGQSVPSSSHQAAPESKIVLQTRSEVDLLDDGYKWRKYGQKVVKGNLHPRSYYRCTYAGCNVRKHVERPSADPKSVITTYEGKHNHDLPVGKHSSSHGANAKQSQTQTAVSKSLPEMSYGSKSTTLQLKDQQIMA